jgi:hypothetical protein
MMHMTASVHHDKQQKCNKTMPKNARQGFAMQNVGHNPPSSNALDKMNLTITPTLP